MGEVINLRQARKQRDRAERARVADGNRAAFGRSKAEKDAESARRARADSQLDGHRLSTDEDGKP